METVDDSHIEKCGVKAAWAILSRIMIGALKQSRVIPKNGNADH